MDTQRYPASEQQPPQTPDQVPPDTPHCMWVFETSQVEGGYVPSVVYENVPGHFPLSGNGAGASPWIWGPTLKQAKQQAASANRELGISPERALQIVLSSMAAQNDERRGLWVPPQGPEDV